MSTTEALWLAAMQHSLLGTTVASVGGKLLFVNRAFCDMVGRSEQELVATDFNDITHPEDRARSLRELRRVAAGDTDGYRIEKRYLHADGSAVWADLSVVLVRDDTGQPRFVVAQVIDATKQHQDREELARATRIAERERLLGDAMLDSVPVGLVLIDSDGHYERMNRHHRAFLALAYPDGHLDRAGQPGLVYAADGKTEIAPADLPSSRAARGEEFSDYRIWVGDDPLTRRALAVSAQTVNDSTGTFIGAALSYVDVTALLSTLQVQSSFLGAVSHELRTPLTSILGHLELLEDLPGEAPAAWERPLAVIRRNAARLQRLVADLLHQTEIQTVGLSLDRRVVDVSVLVCEAVESALLAASGAGVTLSSDTSGTAECRVDPERVRQVLDNVIGNAIKYTDPGGRVTVSCRVTGSRASTIASRDALTSKVVIDVLDTGVGISDHDAAHVFDPFYRGAESETRQAAGLGLGLSIVRAIVTAHGGTIRIESCSGTGTRLTIELPARTTA